MAGLVAKKGKKNRKHGRNKLDCARYAGEGRAEKSKARKLAAHLAATPWDGAARNAFEKLSATARKGLDVPKSGKSPVVLRREAGVTLAASLRARKAA